SRSALKEQTYRKTVLLAVKDVRVLCLKFWDRIDNLQTIQALNPEKQRLIAEETRTVYVPLARHLGMGRVATELDALSLMILYPTRAERYAAAVSELKSLNESTLGKIRSEVHNILEHHKIDALVRDR
ncbi:MAG: bifunctional (p)ppGpp synthetase/guanosine-3',5'-bis(diphosphate) 3'-pyrophosphohydrolase, partial [Gammaproteobacteria bacterium]|nr:bifunctional (p)ppGpp synthetase/guanosine-3',5'-bis(diphosphate) 3'-pyrophosphohydrolase [Gammaproteobacteria bacterium]NIQ09022.1 bifunctional (p)ppGpp synthetase/guanosine-3',5'-bis(diphosphate) 3'-pyrophosphohydrolase [Gammaproteobacteria bacterium]NIR25879.1 bifunctional (p)ppGpp synthetase/guanosine-3',5'-bis(diphosphate) 3'-pyrophosphohydrolase [Gammaproteobacteria bacterium]NIX16821.1 HD domain-containing protein [Gammaproteobacteria bacterium]NIY19039.1 HD domain-containing protein 